MKIEFCCERLHECLTNWQFFINGNGDQVSGLMTISFNIKDGEKICPSCKEPIIEVKIKK